MEFKIRTCKKIAELTQVIHILFTQNHEKDLIINELKNFVDNYQEEMEEMLQSMRNYQITLNEQNKQMLLKELNEQFFEEERKIKDYYGSSATFLQNELEKTVASLTRSEKQLNAVNAKYDKLQLDKIAREFSLGEEIASLKQEILLLVDNYKVLEQKHQILMKKALNSDAEFRGKFDNMKNENTKLCNRISELSLDKTNLENRCKEMEMELSSLSQQLAKQKKALQRSETAASISQKTSITVDSNINEELRKELIRYKLELSNRDNNYTRLFTKTGPRIQESFTNHRNSQSDLKGGFNAVIGLSQRNIDNATVKIVSAQYNQRNSLPKIDKPNVS